MKNLMKRIENEIERVAMKTGAMGTENVSVRLVLTEDEKKMFVENEKYSNDGHYWWVFEENELIMTYTEDIEPSESLSNAYAEWRKDSEEMLMDGIPGELDCSNDIVRKDFAEYAESKGLNTKIISGEMYMLQTEYEQGCKYYYYDVLVKITDSKLKDICEYMNDDIREKLHSELNSCDAETFLDEYLKEDEDFEKILKEEFHITLKR